MKTNKHMKAIIASILAATMALTLAACGGGENTSSAAASSAASIASETSSMESSLPSALSSAASSAASSTASGAASTAAAASGAASTAATATGNKATTAGNKETAATTTNKGSTKTNAALATTNKSTNKGSTGTSANKGTSTNKGGSTGGTTTPSKPKPAPTPSKPKPKPTPSKPSKQTWARNYGAPNFSSNCYQNISNWGSATPDGGHLGCNQYVVGRVREVKGIDFGGGRSPNLSAMNLGAGAASAAAKFRAAGFKVDRTPSKYSIVLDDGHCMFVESISKGVVASNPKVTFSDANANGSQHYEGRSTAYLSQMRANGNVYFVHL